MAGWLNRPAHERAREFRYRFGQTFVFGIPVLALQWFGPRLGGAEATRWIALLQAILCGWIVYVAAIGMLVEGVFLLAAQKFTPDLFVGAAAVVIYLFSAGAVLPIFFIGHLAYQPTLFHGVVLLLLCWCAGRWWWLARASRFGGGL
jgi:cation transport ATPase